MSTVIIIIIIIIIIKIIIITSRMQSIGRAKASSTLLYQFIEPVMFVCCAFIFALRNITLGGYLDTRRNI